MAKLQNVSQFYMPQVLHYPPDSEDLLMRAPKTEPGQPSRSFYGVAGPKACTQCGTTRTPQWREGPLGPKTLCNACGVKRVRQQRAASEGKRKAAAASAPAAFPPKLPAPQQHVSKVPSPEPTAPQSSDSDGAVAPKRPRDGTPQRRPVRKAAAKAASRTAEFASTGDWPEDEEDVSCPQHVRPSSAAGRLGDADAISDLSEHSEQHSDSAEELSWPPQHRRGALIPPSPAAAASHIGIETSAAVNLLSMSFRDTDAAPAAAPTPATHQGDARQQHCDTENQPASIHPRSTNAQASATQQQQAGSYAFMATYLSKFGFELPMDASSMKVIQEVLSNLPPDRSEFFAALHDGAVVNDRNIAAADAAVAAVAKVLAKNQAKATREHMAGESHSRKLYEFLARECSRKGKQMNIKRRRLH